SLDLHSYPTRRSSDLIDLKEVKYLFSVKTIDGWTWIVTVLATLIIGIEVGIIIGVGFSLIVLFSSKGKLNLTELGYLRETNRYRSEEHTSELQSRFDI